jgi:hypothetical protein
MEEAKKYLEICEEVNNKWKNFCEKDAYSEQKDEQLQKFINHIEYCNQLNPEYTDFSSITQEDIWKTMAVLEIQLGILREVRQSPYALDIIMELSKIFKNIKKSE